MLGSGTALRDEVDGGGLLWPRRRVGTAGAIAVGKAAPVAAAYHTCVRTGRWIDHLGVQFRIDSTAGSDPKSSSCLTAGVEDGRTVDGFF